MEMSYGKSLAALILVTAAFAGSAPLHAAPSSPTIAGQPDCALDAGLPTGVKDAYDMAQVCLASPRDGLIVRGDLSGDLATLGERHRAQFGQSPLRLRESLDAAALIHAMDMATRQFAAHEDLEGRSHPYRIRLLDRRVLVGATGANITILPAVGTDAAAIYAALSADMVNLRNMSRDSFTDTGIGVVEADGRIYVVQVFAQVDGELDAPLPLTIQPGADLGAVFAESGLVFDGWELSGPDGERLARGINPVLSDRAGDVQVGYLEVAVTDGGGYWTLKGPLTGN